MHVTGVPWKLMGLLASVLFALFAAGIIWAVTEIDRTVGPIFAYVAGLVITITPCCLPLFLVITSLTVKQRLYGDALMVAASFGAGIALFSAVLGAALATTGWLVGLSQVSGIVFAVGGAIGYSYAVSELFRLRLPLLGWRMLRMRPASNSYAAAFSTGLILGAGDIGCPNPFRYALLSFIAASAKPATGATLGLLYGLGAITPLILAAILALLGINLGMAMRRSTGRIEKAVNLAFLPIGSFLVTFGVFGEPWYESTIIHNVWEAILLRYGLVEPHGHPGETGTFSTLGNMTFLLMVAGPLGVYFFRPRRNLNEVDGE
jgi:cytochrome c biogenesis protein CcdA